MSTALKLVVFGIILVAIIAILVLLPSVDIDKDAVISSSAWYWVMAALYFIPTHTVVSILTVVIGIGIFSLIVAVVKTIWDLLPFS